MSSLYDRIDIEIKHLIEQGASTDEVAKIMLEQYSEILSESMQVLKRIQRIERDLRRSR